jgi:hypothetical protein
VQPLPEINLDTFKVCTFKAWKAGELMYYSSAMLFGTFSPSNLHLYGSTSGILMKSDISSRYDVIDLIAFSTIVVTAKKSRMGRPLPIPTILDVIL